MNTPAFSPSKGFTMKRLLALPLLLGMALAASPLVNAQTTAATPQAPLTREQVKIERNEFLKTHRYDAHTENWVMKPEFEAPAGMKTREQVRAERDEFLRNNRFDYPSGLWVPLKGSNAPESTKTRAQMREETRQFVRTHEWDSVKEVWQDVKPAMKRSKP
jgi:hypothetical protein